MPPRKQMVKSTLELRKIRTKTASTSTSAVETSTRRAEASSPKATRSQQSNASLPVMPASPEGTKTFQSDVTQQAKLNAGDKGKKRKSTVVGDRAPDSDEGNDLEPMTGQGKKVVSKIATGKRRTTLRSLSGNVVDEQREHLPESAQHGRPSTRATITTATPTPTPTAQPSTLSPAKRGKRVTQHLSKKYESKKKGRRAPHRKAKQIAQLASTSESESESDSEKEHDLEEEARPAKADKQRRIAPTPMPRPYLDITVIRTATRRARADETGSDEENEESRKTRRQKKMETDQNRPDNPERHLCFTRYDDTIAGDGSPDSIWLFPDFASRRERDELKQQIQDNGGQVVDTLEEAGIAVIPRGPAVSFNETVTKACESGVIPVRMCWVTDCIAASRKVGFGWRYDPSDPKLYALRPIPIEREQEMLIKKEKHEPLRIRHDFADEEVQAFAMFKWKWDRKMNFEGSSTSEMIRTFLEKHTSSHSYESWKNFYKPKKHRDEIDFRVKLIDRQHRKERRRGSASPEQAILPFRPLSNLADTENLPRRQKTSPEKLAVGSSLVDRGKSGAVTVEQHIDQEALETEKEEEERGSSSPKSPAAPVRTLVASTSNLAKLSTPARTQTSQVLEQLSETYSLPLEVVTSFWYSSTGDSALFERALKSARGPGEGALKDPSDLGGELWTSQDDRKLLRGDEIDKDPKECKRRRKFLKQLRKENLQGVMKCFDQVKWDD